MATLKTFEVLADTFIRERVATCFALLGDANMNSAAALVDRGCEFIYVRDEHCAVAAAMAWSRSTGKVGFASVTCGPGVTQITTALPAAVRARIPLVIFAGEAPLSKAWYNQQIEQRAIVEACGARYVSMHDVPAMPGQIRSVDYRRTTYCDNGRAGCLKIGCTGCVQSVGGADRCLTGDNTASARCVL